MKILVVDDEKLLVKGIKFNLENDGYEVAAAYDGEEAVELAKTGDFDLIILDIMMPKLTGLEACMQIREFSNVPIIMLTAKGEDMDKLIGFEQGTDDYLTKPFNILELRPGSVRCCAAPHLRRVKRIRPALPVATSRWIPASAMPTRTGRLWS